MAADNFAVHFIPKSDDQKQALELIRKNTVTFLVGPAGTGKTHIALAAALQSVARGDAEQIYLTRPAVEAGESLGYLPGEVDEKMRPYLVPAQECIQRTVYRQHVAEVTKKLVVAPMAYLRGRTFRDGVAVLDEAQNLTYKQLVLYLSRIGENGKMIIAGDLDQSDLDGPDVPLAEVIKRLRRLKGVAVARLTTCVRHPLIGPILERLR